MKYLYCFSNRISVRAQFLESRVDKTSVVEELLYEIFALFCDRTSQCIRNSRK